jgi:phthiocerol/phenolphthiocerol synthesis type-I polyketide synthase C
MRISLREAVVASIAELIGERPDRINDNDRLTDLGVDSMVAVNLLVAIEGRVGMRLPEGSEVPLMESQTVLELVEKVGDALGLSTVAETAGP